MTYRIVLMGVAAFGIGGAAVAAPPSVSAAADQINDDYWNPAPEVRPTSPWVINADPMPKGIYFSGGFSYAEFQGRKFQLKDGLIQIVPSDAVMLYYDRQEYFARGRSGGKLYLDNDVFGLRVSFLRREPDTNSTSVALGFEYDAPGDLTKTDPGTVASYFATKGYHTSLLASDGKRNHYQFTYSYIEGPGDAKGEGYFAGYRRELNPTGRLSADLQVFAGYQGIQYIYDTLEFRGQVELLANYRLASGLNLEAGVTYAPGGLPLTSNRTNGMSSFMIYRPSGVAGDMTNDSVGFVDLRLTYQFRF